MVPAVVAWPAPLQNAWVKTVAFFCTPPVAEVLPGLAAKMTSNWLLPPGSPSYSLNSRLAAAPPVKRTVRHSMLKIRLGAVPDTEVKIPHPPAGHVPPTPSVLMSSQYG